ncbi:MAG: transposase [Deltaproteobacteria bacterium]|nr:transposase [Deltaproteobacteria bacterium]
MEASEPDDSQTSQENEMTGKSRRKPRQKTTRPPRASNDGRKKAPDRLSGEVPLFIVLTDQIVSPPNAQSPAKILELRMVRAMVFDRKNHQARIMRFITNNRKLSPNTIAMLYHERWKIEMFFKTIKQNLIIKNFFGASYNAVCRQVHAAMAAIAMVNYLQAVASSYVSWNFSNLIFTLRLSFFSYFNIFEWSCDTNVEKRPPPKTDPIRHCKLF